MLTFIVVEYYTFREARVILGAATVQMLGFCLVCEKRGCGLIKKQEQSFYLSKLLSHMGDVELSATELIGKLFGEIVEDFRIEKGALFLFRESGKAECLARSGIGDNVTSLLMTDVREKLPDLRFFVPTLYRAQEALLSRVYLLLGDAKTQIVLVAYNVAVHSKTYRLMKQRESLRIFDGVCSCLLRGLRQSMLEREVGRSEFSGLLGYRAFCHGFEEKVCDAYVLFRVHGMERLYESLVPVPFLELMSDLSDKIKNVQGNGEAYHIGDSHYVLRVSGAKWDIYQKIKLALAVMNDILCVKRPLSCPDVDIRAGILYYNAEYKIDAVLGKLFLSVEKAAPGSIYVYGQLAGKMEDGESVLLVESDKEELSGCADVPMSANTSVSDNDEYKETLLSVEVVEPEEIEPDLEAFDIMEEEFASLGNSEDAGAVSEADVSVEEDEGVVVSSSEDASDFVVLEGLTESDIGSMLGIKL